MSIWQNLREGGEGGGVRWGSPAGSREELARGGEGGVVLPPRLSTVVGRSYPAFALVCPSVCLL